MSTHTQATATSIRSVIVVEAPIERAFRVFTEDFDQIKPREHNMLPVDIAETVFEPLTGELIDIGEAVAQEVSLALPQSPRLPDALLEPAEPSQSQDGPFAALEQLRPSSQN